MILASLKYESGVRLRSIVKAAVLKDLTGAVVKSDGGEDGLVCLIIGSLSQAST